MSFLPSDHKPFFALQGAGQPGGGNLFGLVAGRDDDLDSIRGQQTLRTLTHGAAGGLRDYAMASKLLKVF